MDYCVITFVSTHAAISAQRTLEGVCPVQIMPVLREISSGCGISVRFSPEHLEPVRAALRRSALPPADYAFYGVAGTGQSLQIWPIA